MGRLRLATLVVLALLAAASVSFNRGRTFELVDAAGTPVDLVYVAYSYVGTRPNPVHPVSYQAKPLALARSDGAGRVTIATAFHVHRPFPLETHPSLWVDLVYVPRLRNAVGQLNSGAPSQPRVFEIDPGRDRAIVSNLEDRPELWEGSLSNLASLIQRLIAIRPGQRPLRETDPATAVLTGELIGHFREEYNAFLARYGHVDRRPPEMPPYVRSSSGEEQRRWAEDVAANLHREPRWGVLITRLFSDRLQSFSQWAAESP